VKLLAKPRQKDVERDGVLLKRTQAVSYSANLKGRERQKTEAANWIAPEADIQTDVADRLDALARRL
jgi:hypothetical protein